MIRRSFSDLWAFLLLGRPQFLVGGVIFHTLGVAMALYSERPLNLTALVLGQIAITATQLMTHYSNDYFDYYHDCENRNSTPWSGGSRVLPEGKLAPRVALFAALLFMGMALVTIAVIVLIVRPSLIAILLLLAGIALAWFYSAPPLRLVGRGLGELTAAIVVPGLTTLTGLTLQGGEVSLRPLLVILPLACFQFVMLFGVEFPDLDSDAETGKRTLVVRLGGEQAALAHTLALVVGYMVMLAGLILIAAQGDISVGVSLFAIWIVTLPFGLWHGSRVALGAWCDPLQWSSVAFWGIALLVGTAGLEVIALGWLAVQRGATLPFL